MISKLPSLDDIANLSIDQVIGGIRVAFFVRWPGVLEPGTTYAPPVSLLDLMPTLAAATGAKLPEDRVYDGVDLRPFWTSKAKGRPHDRLFWRSGTDSAIRDGDLKLVRHGGNVELFDLAADPYERSDLAATRRDEVGRMRAIYDEWEDGVQPPAWYKKKKPFRRWRDGCGECPGVRHGPVPRQPDLCLCGQR